MTDAPPQPDATRDDVLDRLRLELDETEALPVADRVARFRQANDVLARELALLDEI